MGLIIRTPVMGGGQFKGWNNAFSSLNQSAFILISVFGFVDTSTRYWVGTRTATTGLNMFQSSPKNNPTVWTTHLLPFTCNNVAAMLAADDNTLYIGLNNPGGDSRVYQFIVSTLTFTNLAFPNNALSSSIAQIVRHPTNTDLLYVANGATGGNPCGIWEFKISTTTWTQIGGSGTGWNVNGGVCNICVASLSDGYHFIASVGFAGVNGADVYQSSVIGSNGGAVTWTKIAGGGTNNSWATGTKRNVNVQQVSGILYAALGGATNGDAELWTQDPGTALWTKIGGNAVLGSWANGTKTVARNAAGLGNIVVCGVAGSGASDAELWQYNRVLQTWVQIAGDAINGSWNNITGAAVEFVTREHAIVCGGGSAAGPSFLYIASGTGFSPGGSGYNFNPRPINIPIG